MVLSSVHRCPAQAKENERSFDIRGWSNSLHNSIKAWNLNESPDGLDKGWVSKTELKQRTVPRVFVHHHSHGPRKAFYLCCAFMPVGSWLHQVLLMKQSQSNEAWSELPASWYEHGAVQAPTDMEGVPSATCLSYHEGLHTGNREPKYPLSPQCRFRHGWPRWREELLAYQQCSRWQWALLKMQCEGDSL